MTSPRSLPMPLPGGPVGVLVPSTANTGLLIPHIEVHVRAPDLTLVGQITAWKRNGGTLRYNNTGDYALEIDLDDDMTAFLQTPKYGIFIVRWLETERGVVVPDTTRTLFSGDLALINPSKQDNTLAVSFKSDLRRLRNRPAFPVTFYPYNTLIEAYGASHLKRFYRLNESSGTSAVDSSGNGQDGTYINGPTLGQTRILGDDGDTCLSLDGVNDYLSVPTGGLSTSADPFSIDVWTQPQALAGGDQALIWCGNSSSVQYAALLLDSTGTWYVTNGSVSTAHSDPVTLDETNYLVLVWDGTNFTLYQNAVPIATVAATLNITFGSLRLGASDALDRFYHGTVSKFGVYNRVLTADEIAENYAVGQSRLAYNDHDDRSGVAEDVIKAYVAASIGPDALPLPDLDIALSDALVTIATSLGRGESVSDSSRMDLLVSDDNSGLVQRLAQNGGVGFDITQFGTQLIFDCYTPADATSDAIFSDDLGNIANYSYKDQAPDSSQGGNVVIVMGGGEGVNRVFRFAADLASIARWGVVMGVPIDSRDTTDITTLDQRAADALAKSAEVASFTCELTPTAGLVFGRDFWLGDKVTVILNDGSTIQDIVREVSVDYSPDQGETLTVAIGTPSTRVVTGALDALGAFLRQELQQTRARVARLERAQ